MRSRYEPDATGRREYSRPWRIPYHITPIRRIDPFSENARTFMAALTVAAIVAAVLLVTAHAVVRIAGLPR